MHSEDLVCLCACVSVKSHFTSGASVHLENTVTYSVGNRSQKICGFFAENALFKVMAPFVVL